MAVALRNRWRRQQVPAADARRDRAQEHHAHRPHRRRQDRDRAPPGRAGRRALRQGRGVEVHRGRLRRPRRRLDGARSRRDRGVDAARRGARAGAARAPARTPRSACSTCCCRRRRGRARGPAPAAASSCAPAPLPTPPADNATRENLRRLLREGKLDDKMVEIDTADAPHVVHRRVLRHRHGGDGAQPAGHDAAGRAADQAPPAAACPRRWRR